MCMCVAFLSVAHFVGIIPTSTYISTVLPSLSVPYNEIIVFNSDLNFVMYWNMDVPPQNKASAHSVGKSVCTFQRMHEIEIYLPSQDL
jgi:hypothetical protein